MSNYVKDLWTKDDHYAPKFISDCFEAYIGAVFMDSGFAGVKSLLDAFLSPFLFFYLKYY
ncbi:MAG: hypothetical protein DHS20C13_28450 [Thermodesulfobacteriota bacterium]|nr:MAG: hypothetical protein DHS20C13_28450 [Thermodesulfobacteriota bacterium]